jgi:hypothetical protein
MHARTRFRIYIYIYIYTCTSVHLYSVCTRVHAHVLEGLYMRAYTRARACAHTSTCARINTSTAYVVGGRRRRVCRHSIQSVCRYTYTCTLAAAPAHGRLAPDTPPPPTSRRRSRHAAAAAAAAFSYHTHRSSCCGSGCCCCCFYLSLFETS